VRAILRAAGTTALLVTHDQEEALSLADTVAMMFAGRLAQVASPQVVYLQPATRQVATFVGAANEIPGTAHGDYATCALGVLPLAAPVQGAVDILLRPEAITVQPDPQGAARVVAVRFFGAYQQGQVRLLDGSTLVAHLPPQQELVADTPVTVAVSGPVVAYPA
jgi:iron(III) transport system ATP-binding protein